MKTEISVGDYVYIAFNPKKVGIIKGTMMMNPIGLEHHTDANGNVIGFLVTPRKHARVVWEDGLDKVKNLNL